MRTACEWLAGSTPPIRRIDRRTIMTAKTRRHWRNAGRCLGLVLSIMWLAGCAALPQQSTVEKIRREQAEDLKRRNDQIEANYSQARLEAWDRRDQECNRHLRIGMTTSEVEAIKACWHVLYDGRLMAWNTTITAAGQSSQVRWGDGYIYFQNGVLVAIQK